MNKRIAALLLCLILSLIPMMPGLAEGLSEREKIDKLVSLVQDYIDQERIKGVEYDSDQQVFTTRYNMDSALKSADVYTFVYYDMLAVRCFTTISVPQDRRDDMAQFITRVNGELSYSYLMMNYDTGEVSCRSYQLVELVFPSVEEIDVLHYMPIGDLDEWGNGILKVIGGANPQTAFEETLQEIEASR